MCVCMCLCNPVLDLLSQNPNLQVKLVEKMMTVPNQIWDSIIAKAAEDTGVLQDESVIRELGHILKINVRGCSSIGHPFVVQVACRISCSLSVSLLSDLLTHQQEVMCPAYYTCLYIFVLCLPTCTYCQCCLWAILKCMQHPS